MRYSYRTVNGRSLLTALDGPLANGKTGTPLDSDITQLHWDERGNAIVALTAPAGEVSKFSYDKAGRIVGVDSGGRSIVLGYDARGRLADVRADGVARRTRFDALDNPVETGTEGPQGYTALARHGFDDAGRMLWRVSHLGVMEQRLIDTEGRLLASSTRGGPFGSVQRYEYDQHGRVVASVDANGAVQRMRYDPQGRPELVVDARGRATRYAYDAQGRIETVRPAANTLFARLQPTAIGFEYDAHGNTAVVRAPTGGATRSVYDDFGRALAQVSPDSGVRVSQYDAAGRLVAGRDALGNAATYEYDVAGRIVRQVVRHAGAGAHSVTTTWKYQGRHLVAIEHPDQRETYRRDAQGRIVARTVGLVLDSGRRVDSTTFYRYDAQGRLAATTLADGSLLEYRRDGLGRIVALQRHRIHTPWLRWLLPSETVVKDVAGSIAGLTGYTYGNGVQARLVRGPDGTLAQIMHRRPGVTMASRQAPLAGLTIDMLLGVRPAWAAPSPATSASPRPPAGNDLSLLGALGRPADPDALLDYRYLWDVRGNLLHQRGRGGANNYAYDAQDRLIVAASAAHGPGTLKVGQETRSARYFYDGAGNRLLAQEDVADAAGATVRASYVDGGNRAQVQDAAVRYDAAGQPLASDWRQYAWDAHGRLLAVKRKGATLASYRYNHRGERIAKTAGKLQRHYLYQERRIAAEVDGEGRLLRQYVYLADRPIQVIDTPDGRAPAHEERSGFGQVLADLGTALARLTSGAEQRGYLHHNHLGAPELVTDDTGKPLWQAAYAPFGKLISAATGTERYEMNLRLPGQYEDAETGLYYNDHRYYDPQRGRYLTPDPLGLRAGINTYAYVAGNPLKYVDPNGLLLIAFDGTDNTDRAEHLKGDSTMSNVVKFRELYRDGKYEYISGVGTLHQRAGYQDITAPLLDAGVNWSGEARIKRMVEYFNAQANDFADDEVMDVDIVGFSRGASQSRDFANLITASSKLVAGSPSTYWYSYTTTENGKEVQKCQKVNFRFMGLFDSVLSTNWNVTYTYKLAIPEQFKYVAHAVALNEFRGHTLPLGRANVTDPYSWGKFTLDSIKPSENAPDQPNRVEKGFIGAHADIGGGFKDNELAKVSFAWMVEQAKKAGVKMQDVADTVGKQVVMHDKSDAIRFGSPTAPSPFNDADYNEQYSIPGWATAGTGAEDRVVRYGSGNTTQREMKGTGLTYAEIAKMEAQKTPFINYDPQRSRSDNITGTVDMQLYLSWLKSNGYDLGGLTVQ